MKFERKILAMTTLNLNYFFLDALLLVTIGTIGYALAYS